MKCRIVIVLLFSVFLSSCDDESLDEAKWRFFDSCSMPEGAAISANNRYIQGSVAVPLANQSSGYFTLHVQRLAKANSSWTTTSIKNFDNGTSPCGVFEQTKALWREFYQDMLNAGVHSNVVQHYIDSISNPSNSTERSNSGVYAETDLSACGYAGAAGTIYCSPYPSQSMKTYYIAHENTHGFNWHLAYGKENEALTLYRVFATYANAFYQQSQTDSSQFSSAGVWSVGTNDYALQNEAEWMAELFRGYLYPGTEQWAYISHNFPTLVSFFDCLWKNDKDISTCQSESGATMVSYPQTVPVVDIPAAAGFSSAESQAIWNICFGTSVSSSHVSTFDSMINRITSGTYTNISGSYKLGYGDCNHDGVMDWICSYKGSAPSGGSYFWNASNQIGAYTFIASGKSGDSYTDYRQDPYLTQPTINGSLAQPMFREWQGTFGSCNGATYFNSVPDRFPIITQSISSLPAELRDKASW